MQFTEVPKKLYKLKEKEIQILNILERENLLKLINENAGERMLAIQTTKPFASAVEK